MESGNAAKHSLKQKDVDKPTSAKSFFQIKQQTVEVIVFSPEVVAPRPVAHPSNGGFWDKAADQAKHIVTEAKNAVYDNTVEHLYNPGHVALHVGDTLYNFGRYWKEDVVVPGTGSAVLRKDSFTQYVAHAIPTRSWIYGFTIVVNSIKPIQKEVEARWSVGTTNPSYTGRKVGEYNIVTNSCKTFTLDLLAKGGVELPGYFGIKDFPVDVRDHFLQWQREDPKRVIKITVYKPDKALKSQ